MIWHDAVTRMDAALFEIFGTEATVSGQAVKVIKEDNFDEFSSMQANGIRLCIQKSSGIKVKKGDQVVYKERTRIVADVPIHEDELIYFNLK